MVNRIACFYPLCTDRSALFRVNAKGQPGIWACRTHIKQTDAKVPEDVDKLVKIIEGKKR